MLITAALITLGVVGYLNIGYWWGRASWKVWHKKERSFAGLLCFPVSYARNKVGEDWNGHKDGLEPVIAAYESDGGCAGDYAGSLMCVWPLKMAFNLCALSLFTVWNLPKLVTNPTALLPKKIHKQLPPAKPEPDQLNLDEHQRLLEQREAIDAQLKELEARPDFKKIKALPKRFWG